MILKVLVPLPTKLYYFAVIVRVSVCVYYLHALVLVLVWPWNFFLVFQKHKD